MTHFQKRIIDVGIAAINNKPRIDKFNHCSLICYKGRILAIGVNDQYKTHTKADKEWPFLHSELQTILQFKRKTRIDFRETELYNVRVGKSGRLLLSRPCESCQKLILAANFKAVYYTNNLGLFEEFKFK